MQTTNNNMQSDTTNTPESLTQIEASQGRRVKGMWIVLAGGAALAVILMAVIALPYGA